MKLLSNNRKAYHEYFIEETFEAGIVLIGTEVKSVKEGKLSIKESYIEIRSGEAFIEGMNVTPYGYASVFNVDPVRPRKLLLNKREINRLYEKVKQAGYTIVPLKVYINDRGLVKMQIGLARGKKLYDKREASKQRDAKREMERALRER
ncbi:MAG: SsrA-binding protein SmpB [Tissierellia bacterium]|nr:SsrA-binding protein SmpB [Bacillota bacterium]NLL22924.1 SsrA-binding protein SmpB [Tissierellia bacterium]